MNRIYHTWDKWECYPAELYNDHPPETLRDVDCQRLYADFLKDSPRFEAALVRVIDEWPKSCEHYLSNENMNRIAWLGQSSACIALSLPASFRTGYHLLSEREQIDADMLALKYLNLWLEHHGEAPIAPEDAKSKTIPNLY